MTDSNKKAIESFLNRLVKQNKTPGVQYLVIEDNKIAFEYCFGAAEFETNKPITTKTFFNVCSVTKTFTSLAIMQLVEKGKLALSDNASKYIIPYPFVEEITIQHFLSHTSGLANPIPLKWAHLQYEDLIFNSAEFVKRVLSTYSNPKHKPGEKFAYSNLNYLALGKIVETVSGVEYRDYICQNIIKKINHDHLPLNFTITNDADYARGYQKKFSVLNAFLGFFIDRKKFTETSSNRKWIKFKKYYVSGRSYGGLIANAYSLSAFIQELFEEKAVLLSNEYKNLLFTKQHLNNGKEIEMTLGWFTGRLNNINYFTHAGGGGGYYCEMRIYPDKNLITAIMFNRTGVNDERFLDKVDAFVL